jgi:ATP-binding cassette subfamily B protein
MNKKTCVKQHDITDCGAACLASVAAFYGLELPISKIRQMASTDKRGTNVHGMIEAAEKVGFLAKGVKSINPDGSKKTDPLYKIPKPAIAHVIVKESLQHFVVIYRISKTHIWIMDPADGKISKKSIADFTKEWTGVLIILG